MQAIALTWGHLANPLEQRRARAGQSMIAGEYSFVQSYPPCWVNSSCPINTNDTTRQKETDGRLKEQRPHVAQHNLSVPPHTNESGQTLQMYLRLQTFNLWTDISAGGTISVYFSLCVHFNTSIKGESKLWARDGLWFCVCNASFYRSEDPNYLLQGSWKIDNLALIIGKTVFQWYTNS